MACVDTLDPTSDDVYDFLRRFLIAASALFPDSYLFLGGDEVDAAGCWGRNPRIAAWLAAHNTTAASLQRTFWRRVWEEVLPAVADAKANASRASGTSAGEAAVAGVWQGADEAIPLSDLPRGAYVNTWQGAAALAAATRAGVHAVASSDWYLDTVRLAGGGCAASPPYALQQAWRCFWAAEPSTGLSDEQEALLLGGQVSAWGEGVSAETLDARVWSRAAAAAERLWSPRAGAAVDAVAALKDAERRLDAHVCRMRLRGIGAEPIRAGFCPPDLGDDSGGNAHVTPSHMRSRRAEPLASADKPELTLLMAPAAAAYDAR